MTEIKVDIRSNLLARCIRVAFVLPTEGNNTEFMAVDIGESGFTDLLIKGKCIADNIAQQKRLKREEEVYQKEWAEYLRLKKKFE